MPRASRTSDGRSYTSCSTSRRVSRITGNIGWPRATSSSAAERCRCCHSGMRVPGRSLGMSSDRAAHSRKREANSADPPTSSVTICSSSSGSKTNSSAPGGSASASGMRAMMPSSLATADPVDAESLPDTRVHGERPWCVHVHSVGGVQDDAPVADLVTSALDVEHNIGRQRAGGRELLFEVREQVGAGAVVRGRLRAGGGARSRAAPRRPRGWTSPSASPSSAGRPRLSPVQNGTRPGCPNAGSTLTRSCVISTMRQLVVPRVKTSFTRDS